MVRAPSRIAALALVLSVGGCVTYRPVPARDLTEDPDWLVGKTIRFRTAQGEAETITIRRVGANQLVGCRPGEPEYAQGAYRDAEEVAFDARTITDVVLMDTSGSAGTAGEVATFAVGLVLKVVFSTGIALLVLIAVL